MLKKNREKKTNFASGTSWSCPNHDPRWSIFWQFFHIDSLDGVPYGKWCQCTNVEFVGKALSCSVEKICALYHLPSLLRLPRHIIAQWNNGTPSNTKWKHHARGSTKYSVLKFTSSTLVFFKSYLFFSCHDCLIWRFSNVALVYTEWIVDAFDFPRSFRQVYSRRAGVSFTTLTFVYKTHLANKFGYTNEKCASFIVIQRFVTTKRLKLWGLSGAKKHYRIWYKFKCEINMIFTTVTIASSKLETIVLLPSVSYYILISKYRYSKLEKQHRT